MSKGNSGLFEGTSGVSYELGQLPLVTRNPVLEAVYQEEHTVRIVYGKFSTELNEDKQGKHIKGHKNYQEGRSILEIDFERAQELINLYAGKGILLGDNREKVHFPEIIGTYIDFQGNKGIQTDWGLIHYSKSGAHIVPASPNQF